MLKKATYHWYNTINETMKDTMAHIHDIQPMPTLLNVLNQGFNC